MWSEGRVGAETRSRVAVARPSRRAWIATLATLSLGASELAEPGAVRSSAEEPAVDASWLARAQRQIGRLEYRPSQSERGLQAPNRAHGLRTYFTPSGVRIHERTAAGAELLGLRLAGVGRGTEIVAPPSGEVTSRRARVEIRRPGLVEWYENSRAGLEQGFTLTRRPPGEGPLVLELDVDGAVASLWGERVRFATATGRRLDYGHLAVFDADGRTLPAYFALTGTGRVRMVVEDAGAAYPVVVDPLIGTAPDTQIDYAGGDDAFLGFSVASAGDVNGDGHDDVIVGAPRYHGGGTLMGSAFLFLGGVEGVADGTPGTAATRLASDQDFSGFGASVASAGDVNDDGYDDVVVGASSYSIDGTRGAAFVFLGGPGGVARANASEAHAVIASGGFARVAGAGDVNGDGYDDVVVGGNPVLVFEGSAAGISGGGAPEAATRLDLAGQASHVAGAGDVNGDGYDDLILGVPGADFGQSEEGAGLLYLGGAEGIPDGDAASATARIESDQAAAHLGRSVAGAGDVNGDGYDDVVLGAPDYDGASGAGAVFLFHGSASGIASGGPAAAAARIESDRMEGEFGLSVSGAGDRDGDGHDDIVVGAPTYATGTTAPGAAFVFLGGAAGIGDRSPASADARLDSLCAPGENPEMAYSVAGAGDVNGDGHHDLVVGHIGYPCDWNSGAAFVYLGGPSVAIATGPQDFSYLGQSVAGAGDVNGDGYGDVIVGAPGYDGGETDEGAAFVFLGSPLALAAQLESDQTDAHLGQSVAGAGDVNGDGYDDVVVGAPTYEADGTDGGAAFLFLGGPDGVSSGNPAAADTRIQSDRSPGLLGYSVAGAGDVNGDGYDDLVVGAPGLYDSEAGSVSGVAVVFHGSAAGIAHGTPATADTRFASFPDFLLYSFFAGSVAGAGDVNGDGYDDVLVGDSGFSEAFLLLGNVSGIADADPSTAVSFSAPPEICCYSYWGISVASAGDVNGDSYGDVIVGAPGPHDGFRPPFGAFVYHGGPGIGIGSPPVLATHLAPALPSERRLGASVASAGDVNADGYDDVLVGAPDFWGMEPEPTEGAAYVFLGSAAGVLEGDATTATLRFEPGLPAARFGASVASAGDVNGDGVPDFVIGAPWLDDEGFSEGSAFLYLPEPALPLALTSGLALAGLAHWRSRSRQQSRRPS